MWVINWIILLVAFTLIGRKNKREEYFENYKKGEMTEDEYKKTLRF